MSTSQLHAEARDYYALCDRAARLGIAVSLDDASTPATVAALAAAVAAAEAADAALTIARGAVA